MRSDKTKRAIFLPGNITVFDHFISSPIKILKVEPGHVVLQMKVRREMLNGFHTCHGGILFSMADTALAFASNSHGRLCVLAEANISYPESVYKDDILKAEAIELSVKNRIAIYNVSPRRRR